MLPEVQAFRGGISDTTAWKLVHGLRQNSDRFSHQQAVQSIKAPVGSSRTFKLRAALYDLNIQIRKTFTILPLELLLHLESELEESSLQQSLAPDSSNESRPGSTCSDLDDATSQSSVRSSSSLSREQPLSLLESLCTLLEARVNSLLIPVEPKDTDRVSEYPRLTRLVRYICLLPMQTEPLEFIPIPDSRQAPFLFNIAEDSADAAAFVALREPAQKLPGETRRRMLEEVNFMKDRFSNLNFFVNSLQVPIGILDNPTARSSQGLASPKSFALFMVFNKVRQQTATACRAIFSQFGVCTDRERIEHKALLQLPGWEEFLDCHSTEITQNLAVRLFFTGCTHKDWQPASMYTLQSKHTNACTKGRLCKALNSAYDEGRDLEFYVSDHSESTDPGEIPIHIPLDPKTHQRYGDSYQIKDLWTLIQNGYFLRHRTMDLWLHADCNATVWEIDQRKSLAVKIVLGLMLSIESDHIIDIWDPKRIQLLSPTNTEFTPCVFIYDRKKSSSRPDNLSLAKLTISDNYRDDDDLKALPMFTLLAKALLHIARGERLEGLHLAEGSGKTFLEGREKLRKMVETYTFKMTCGKEIDRDTLPFLRAAWNCLEFHKLYRGRLESAPSTSRVEIALDVVFDHILTQIDSSLTLGKLVQPKTNTPSNEETDPVAQREVRVSLFDGENATKDSIEAQRARFFFNMLDEFNDSYSRFVDDRVEVLGKESPRRIRIAVIDTGIDFRHPGIMIAKDKGRLRKEWCHSWVGAETDVQDEDDEIHGTNCAYILHKAAPEANIYIEKVFQRNNLKTYQAKNIAMAINHAVRQWDVDIISMSFGLRPPEPRKDGNLAEERAALKKYEELVDGIETAIRDASVQSPRIMFAAASNAGKSAKRAFPAKYSPWVVGIHASDGKGADGGINPAPESGANFMTLGMGLELMERQLVFAGETQIPAYKTVYRSGTSFAAPIAAGVAATVLDLAARVSEINDRARNKLLWYAEMEKMFGLMSIPKPDIGGVYHFLAPWNYWEMHWQANETKARLAWDSINNLFSA